MITTPTPLTGEYLWDNQTVMSLPEKVKGHKVRKTFDLFALSIFALRSTYVVITYNINESKFFFVYGEVVHVYYLVITYFY